MPLPTIDSPTYTLTLPISKRKISYRPFRVKEEKILMIAAESGDLNTIYQAIQQVVLSCTNETLNIFQESSVDSEYALISLRSSSVGETMKPNLVCSHCNESASVKVTSGDLVIDEDKSIDNKIKISENLVIELKYPSFADEVKNGTLQDEVDMVFDSVCTAIDKIYFDDEIFDTEDYKQDELEEFIDNLNAEVFTQIVEYIKTKPTVKIPIEFVCPHCKKKNDQLLEGMESFFG